MYQFNHAIVIHNICFILILYIIINNKLQYLRLIGKHGKTFDVLNYINVSK